VCFQVLHLLAVAVDLECQVQILMEPLADLVADLHLTELVAVDQV
jgi:hypothetical protein